MNKMELVAEAETLYWNLSSLFFENIHSDDADRIYRVFEKSCNRHERRLVKSTQPPNKAIKPTP